MGAVGGLLGVGGGAGGSGFSGPQSATIANPVEAGQTNTAYTGVQNSMQQQQALLAALQSQNGLQNQNQVYNQLQGVANGTGPNPAQAMLNQQTGQNVANQAALMAGQRGAGANTGLIARQAAQQGANLQQQAIGQGATMQAQQALNAIGQAGNLASTQAANQIGQANANVGAQQAEQQALLNATQGVNNANVQQQVGINQANAGMANQRLSNQGSMVGGVFNSLSGAGKLLGAEGGQIPGYADGGGIPTQIQAPPSAFGPQSSFAKILSAQNDSIASPQAINSPIANDPLLEKGSQNLMTSLIKPGPMTSTPGQVMAGGPMDAGSPAAGTAMAAKGGKVESLVSPGEKYLSPQSVEKVEQGASPMAVGKTIPGKPKVGGDKNSYANDTVPATLEEGGIVLPRSVTQSKDPSKAAAQFVGAILAKQGKGLK